LDDTKMFQWAHMEFHQNLYNTLLPPREMLATYLLTHTFEHTLFDWFKFTWVPPNYVGPRSRHLLQHAPQCQVFNAHLLPVRDTFHPMFSSKLKYKNKTQQTTPLNK